jgi:hypothetical protein
VRRSSSAASRSELTSHVEQTNPSPCLHRLGSNCQNHCGNAPRRPGTHRGGGRPRRRRSPARPPYRRPADHGGEGSRVGRTRRCCRGGKQGECRALGTSSARSRSRLHRLVGLRICRHGAGIDAVEHQIVKPPVAWRGSLAETLCDLDSLTEPKAFFSRSASETASQFSKNANVAMTTALA